MFLNHQMDVELLDEMGKEFKRLFENSGATKVVTIESSGIAIAVFVAKHLGLPALFAKKAKHKNVGDDVYSVASYSFTHGKEYTMIVSKKYLNKGDKVLIIDDFLAGGNACNALLDIIDQAEAEVVGIGIAIEKEIAAIIGRRRHLEHHAVYGYLCVTLRGNGFVSVARIGGLAVKKIGARGETGQTEDQRHYCYLVYLHCF